MARRGSGSARRSSRLSSTAAARGSGGASAGVPSHHSARRSPNATHTARASAPRPDREGERAERPRDEGRSAGARRRGRVADGRPGAAQGHHVRQRDGAPPQEVCHDDEVHEGEDLRERPHPRGDPRRLGTERSFLFFLSPARHRAPQEVDQEHEGGEREERHDGRRHEPGQANHAGHGVAAGRRRSRHPDHGGQPDHEACGERNPDERGRHADTMTPRGAKRKRSVVIGEALGLF